MKRILAGFLSPVKAKTHLLNKMSSPVAKRVDSQDLKAFEESFSSSPSNFSFEELLVARTEESPVKKRNRTFENDFNSDFENDDNDQIQHSLQNINIQDLRKSETSASPYKKFAPSSPPIRISDQETSSPSFHRTETLLQGGRVLYPSKPPTPPLFSSTLKIIAPSNMVSSPTRNTEEFYPKLEEYNNRYHGSPTRPNNNTRQKSVTPRPNSHIFLSTQRVSVMDTLFQKNMSTVVDKPIDEDKVTDRKIYKTGHHQHQPHKPIKTVKPIILSEEQEHVQSLVLKGKNLFYTGSAGTGKSILLRSIIKELKRQYQHEEGSIAVTASTGLAAVNIGGSTLHSFAGIGLGKEPYPELLRKIKKSKKSLEKWRNCKVLIIDEISMISGDLFNKLDNIACSLKKNDEPFGGIQVVACGDFFQLPPVIKDDEDETNRFCFNSHSWKRTMNLSITLTTVFRQKGDEEFISMLNDMRLGIVNDDAIKKFRELERPLPSDDGIIPAELFPTRAEVEKANNYRLRNINQPSEVYYAMDGGILENPEQRQRLLSNFMAPDRLELKKGAQVMMIKNMDESLVNGSLGKVVDFVDQATYLSFKAIQDDMYIDEIELQRKSLAKRKKEVGKTDPEFDPDADFVPLDDISSSGLDDTIFDFLNEIQSDDAEVQANIERKKRLIKALRNSSRGAKAPLVKFLTPDGTSRTVLVQTETWTVEDEKGDPLVSRVQFPLILAWSLSIHKSQGQTLPKVKVNLGKIFEKGQAYVALSRAVSREGLQVLNFNKSKVFVHPEVLKFYDSLKDVYYYLNKNEENDEEGDESELFQIAAISKKRRLEKR